jgi:hypothetical protein
MSMGMANQNHVRYEVRTAFIWDMLDSLDRSVATGTGAGLNN